MIPTPISTCRYYRRTLNVPKLVDAKFTYVPRNMTIARMVRQFKAPSTVALSRSGLREMEDKDVPAVSEPFRRYTARFDLVPLVEEGDVRHQFLSGRGKGERGNFNGLTTGPTRSRKGPYVTSIRRCHARPVVLCHSPSSQRFELRFLSSQNATGRETASHNKVLPLFYIVIY